MHAAIRADKIQMKFFMSTPWLCVHGDAFKTACKLVQQLGVWNFAYCLDFATMHTGDVMPFL